MDEKSGINSTKVLLLVSLLTKSERGNLLVYGYDYVIYLCNRSFPIQPYLSLHQQRGLLFEEGIG